MSLRIGQIRKNNNTSYLTDLSSNIVDTTIGNVGLNRVFRNYGIQLRNGFTVDNTYYLRFAVKRIETTNHSGDLNNDPNYLNFSLSLYTDRSTSNGQHELGTYQDIASNIVVDPKIIGDDTDTENYRYFEFIFTPNRTYNYLAFVLTRIGADYTNKARTVSSEDIKIKGELGDLSIINNVFTDGRKMDKIGIQTRPGTLLCINREDIRVGRSGIYEVNNGIKINFVGFAGPNGTDATNINDFILDYAYDE